jgi:hypothetical protein
LPLGDRKNGFAKAVDPMKNNEVCESVQGLSAGIYLAMQPSRSETKLEPYQFDEMLRQAWLILNSPEQAAAGRAPSP